MKVSVLFIASTSGALCFRRLKPRCYCRSVLMSAGGEVLALLLSLGAHVCRW